MTIGSNIAKPKRDDVDLAAFVRAVEEFELTGKTSLLCDRCKKPVIFDDTNPRCIFHSCECGKFNGTLKGL